MKQEFMLYIRNAGDAKSALSPDQHTAFIKHCETYIGQLKTNGHLIAAQPIVRQGFVVTKTANGWIEIPIDPTKEVQVGYYHIMALSSDPPQRRQMAIPSKRPFYPSKIRNEPWQNIFFRLFQAQSGFILLSV